MTISAGALPSGSSGHTIEDEGSVLTARTSLNFVGAGVTATDAGGKTVVTIPSSSPVVAAPGNLGTAQTVTFTGAEERVLPGTLNGNLAITSSSPVAGSKLRVFAVQDATGGRTLTVDGVSIPIALGAGEEVNVLVYWISTTAFKVDSAGVGDLLVPDTITGNYTAVQADGVGRKKIVNSASAVIITLPALTIGTTIPFKRKGAGTATFAAGSGLTLQSISSFVAIASQYGEVVAHQETATLWALAGNLG